MFSQTFTLFEHEYSALSRYTMFPKKTLRRLKADPLTTEGRINQDEIIITRRPDDSSPAAVPSSIQKVHSTCLFSG